MTSPPFDADAFISAIDAAELSLDALGDMPLLRSRRDDREVVLPPLDMAASLKHRSRILSPSFADVVALLTSTMKSSSLPRHRHLLRGESAYGFAAISNVSVSRSYCPTRRRRSRSLSRVTCGPRPSAASRTPSARSTHLRRVTVPSRRLLIWPSTMWRWSTALDRPPASQPLCR